MSDGTARCWGEDTFAELGDGNQTFAVPAPTPVVGLADIKAITAGDSYTCALKTDGTGRLLGQ